MEFPSKIVRYLVFWMYPIVGRGGGRGGEGGDNMPMVSYGGISKNCIQESTNCL